MTNRYNSNLAAYTVQDANGPDNLGNKFTFATTQQVSVLHACVGDYRYGGPAAGDTVTMQIRDATGTTVLATATVAAANTTGTYDLAIPLSTPFVCNAGTTYSLWFPESLVTSNNLYRRYQQGSVSTNQSDATNTLTWLASGGSDIANDAANILWSLDMEWSPASPVSSSSTPAAKNFTMAAVQRASSW